MASPERLAPAALLAGRFRLDEVLGRGGMATVWSAHDTRLDRTVAIKVLHDHLSAEDAARIEREARAAARITDARVVPVLDLDHTDDGRPFLVFEALSGRTLADEIRERGALSPDRAERLADDLLGGLAAAHACGVLHRDIKPSNVLVDGDRFRITDFGIASVEDETATSGDLIGTLGYLAPERFDGSPATPASDVFAAAAVLYEAVAGRQPFRAPTAAETIERLRSGSHDPIPATVSDRLREMISRGLAPDPARRPDDAHDLTEREPSAGAGGARVDHQPTERLDVTARLAPPMAPAYVGTRPAAKTSASGRVDAILRHPRVAETTEWLRHPRTVLIGTGIALLVFLVLVSTLGGGSAETPTSDDPSARLDEQLERIEELG